MPEYPLRNIDPLLWSRFTERANHDGWPTRALFIALMEGYADGSFTPAAPAPQSMPEFAWLRPHYRAAAASKDFASLSVADKWRALVDQVLESPADIEWKTVEAVPVGKRLEILKWLETSGLHSRDHGFTLRAIAHVGDAADPIAKRRVFQYQVLGLPPGREAMLANADTSGWRILYIVNGVTQPWGPNDAVWGQPHVTTDEALRTLDEMVSQTHHPTPTA